MATKRQRRKRRKRRGGGDAGSEPVASATNPSALAADDAQRAATARRRGTKGPPDPPWGSFPLSELAVLVAIVLLVAGFFTAPPLGGVMIGVSLLMGSAAGLELAIREHFAGYKSHTSLLAGAAAVLVVAGLFALGPDSLPLIACIGIGAVVFGAVAYALALAFRRRSGGALFSFKG